MLMNETSCAVSLRLMLSESLGKIHAALQTEDFEAARRLLAPIEIEELPLVEQGYVAIVWELLKKRSKGQAFEGAQLNVVLMEPDDAVRTESWQHGALVAVSTYLPELAEDAFTLVEQRHPESLAIAFQRGVHLLHTGRPEEAIPLFTRAIEHNQPGPAFVCLAQCHRNLGEAAQAIATLRDGITRAANDAELIESLAIMLADTGEYAEAYELFERAYAIEGNRDALWWYYGLAGFAEASIERIERALIHSYRGSFQYNALEAFARILDPKRGDVVSSLSRALEDTGAQAQQREVLLDRAITGARRHDEEALYNKILGLIAERSLFSERVFAAIRKARGRKVQRTNDYTVLLEVALPLRVRRDNLEQGAYAPSGGGRYVRAYRVIADSPREAEYYAGSIEILGVPKGTKIRLSSITRINPWFSKVAGYKGVWYRAESTVSLDAPVGVAEESAGGPE